MPFRRTKSLFSDINDSDAVKESDVVLSAAILGFAADQVSRGECLRLDIDPSDRDEKWTAFNVLVERIDSIVARHLDATGTAPAGKVHAGISPDYAKGAVIMGIYQLAGHEEPMSVVDPILSPDGKVLFDQIKNGELPQYTGRGAYTGFVDDPNGEPVGPRPSVRFLAPTVDPVFSPGMGSHPRWLPSDDSALWRPRRREDGTVVPWGLIGGNQAQQKPQNPDGACRHVTNKSDQITCEMHAKYGMEFCGDPGPDDIAGYTHGMVQAIYKAYTRGPACAPYEIAVGTETRKMASCIPCTFFMVAQGYPPTSIHLGRGESWIPLFEPHNPQGSADDHELAVIRDLNLNWRNACAEYLELGMHILGMADIAASHVEALGLLNSYLASGSEDGSAASTLILDALTMHDSEFERLQRTLGLDGR